MGLFNFLSDVKDIIDTSNREKQEREEKKRKIDEYNQEARDYVSEGKYIYDDAYSDFSAYSWGVEKGIREHYEFKEKVLKELGENVNPIIRNFKSFNIDNKISAPSIPSAKTSSVALNQIPTLNATSVNLNIKSMVTNFTGTLDGVSMIDLIFDWVRDLDEELSQARRNRSKAESYRSKMRQAAEKLKTANSELRNVDRFISDEHKTINSLTSKLRPMITTLKNGMAQNSFTQKEAEYLKGINKIADNLAALISTRFLTDDFRVRDEYKLVYNKVKNIESMLSAAPVIPNDLSFLNALLKILDGTVVY